MCQATVCSVQNSGETLETQGEPQLRRITIYNHQTIVVLALADFQVSPGSADE
jgi:hypothetical protein